jgi:hypothetical protein
VLAGELLTGLEGALADEGVPGHRGRVT